MTDFQLLLKTLKEFQKDENFNPIQYFSPNKEHQSLFVEKSEKFIRYF